MPLSTLTVETEARSDDGTVKTLFHTADGLPIEAVLTTPTTSALPGAGFGPRHANCAAMKKDALVTLVLAALLLVAISPAVEATKPAPIKVRTSDPFYPILEAFGEGGVEPGSVLNGCRLVPFAKCPGAELGGQETDRGDPARLEPAWAARERRRTGGVAVSLSDLRGASLRKISAAALIASYGNLQGADLTGADLTLGGLAEMHAHGATLRGANLHSADISAADLSGAELAGATFCNTIMPSGSVRNHRAHCPIPQPSLHGPTITIPPEAAIYMVLKETSHSKLPDPTGIRLRGCLIVSEAACPGANLQGIKVHGAFLTYARLPKANFNNANLTVSDFVGGILVRADLREADFREANMTKADLRYADLRETDLGSVALVGADLRNAKFGRTDLSEVVLASAKLPQNFPQGTIPCNTILPDGTVANPQKECEPH